MKPSLFIRVAILCVLLLALAATPWLPWQVSLLVGSGAFVVLILSMVAATLHLAKAKKRLAGGFFIIGLFLLLIALPSYDAVESFFEPPLPSRHARIHGDIVFGVLAVACLIRAGHLWTSDEKNA